LGIILKFALLALGVALVAWNALATLTVVRDRQLEFRQKALQIVFVWFIPVVGASLVWFLIRQQRTERSSTNLSDSLPGDGDFFRNDSAADGFSSGEGGADGGSH